MKKLTVKKINKVVFGDLWEGPVDHQALEERLGELLESEELLAEWQRKMKIVRSILMGQI
jgi:hypothetical protein